MGKQKNSAGYGANMGFITIFRHSQYLQSRDLVLQDLLGLVEVAQDYLQLPLMDDAELAHLPLMSLGEVLLVSPEKHMIYFSFFS